MADIQVRNASELQSALQNASGGDRIVLAGGDYGSLNLTNTSYSSEVTVVSADASNPAILTGLFTNNVTNLTFDGIKFDYSAPNGPQEWFRPFEISYSTNVAVLNSTFDGDIARGAPAAVDGFGTGIGLYVNNSTNVAVSGNEFYEWYRGAFFENVDGFTLTNNDVHDIRSDGMIFANTDNAIMEGNHFHDFRTAPNSGDHPDFMQFYTIGTSSPSQNVTIRANAFDIGQGDWTETIFMGNLGSNDGNDASMFYSNILIEDNVIRNEQINGITMYYGTGITVQNNTMVTSASISDGILLPSILLFTSSNDVTVTGNVAHQVQGVNATWNVANNTLVQVRDFNEANHVSTIPIQQMLDPIIAGAGTGNGSTVVVPPVTPPPVTPPPGGSTTGTDQDDVITASSSADTIDLTAGGSDQVIGGITDLFSDTISGFGYDDTILAQGTQLTRGQITSPSGQSGTTTLGIDADKDGFAEGSISFDSLPANGDFMVSMSGNDTSIAFVDYMVQVSDGLALSGSDVNGIANQSYLHGDTSESYIVNILQEGSAGYSSSLGVYEVDPNGNLIDVQVIAQNVKTATGPITVTDVEAGNMLGFFLIQDGANTIASNVLASDTLEFYGGDSGSVSLGNNGSDLDNAVVFLSHDSQLNIDGLGHAVSGVMDDGSGGLRIGFEDRLRDGSVPADNDFQDVVFTVEALYD